VAASDAVGTSVDLGISAATEIPFEFLMQYLKVVQDRVLGDTTLLAWENFKRAMYEEFRIKGGYIRPTPEIKNPTVQQAIDAISKIIDSPELREKRAAALIETLERQNPDISPALIDNAVHEETDSWMARWSPKSTQSRIAGTIKRLRDSAGRIISAA
jgi:hypothetical protein